MSRPGRAITRRQLKASNLAIQELATVRRESAIGVAQTIRWARGNPHAVRSGSLPIHVYREPEELARRLERLPGVVEHGLFLTQIDMVVIASGDTVKVVTRTKY